VGLVRLAVCVGGRGNGGTRAEAAPQSQSLLQMVPPGLAPANFLSMRACRGPGSRAPECVAQVCPTKVERLCAECWEREGWRQVRKLQGRGRIIMCNHGTKVRGAYRHLPFLPSGITISSPLGTAPGAMSLMLFRVLVWVCP